jgi:UDP-N-acetyl-D-mannosaminuronic acid dehydrogenase
MTTDTISVVGLGYIGLPTAAMFASRGKKVKGIDVDQGVIDTINGGKIHIVEPALDVLVKTVVEEGLLSASMKPEPADVFLIAVPTPFAKDQNGDPEPDLSYLKAAAMSIAPFLRRDNLVILESTSPVGTTEKLVKWLAVARPDLSFPDLCEPEADINVAYCPERVLPGQVISELVSNDRVIGGMSPKCAERAVELYRTFVIGECVITNARTAEMVKLTENSCRDVQLAFANELSVICNNLDIDVWELIALANRHPRVDILQPGPGVGGHCIAVDPWFIVSSAPKDTRIIRMARLVNDDKPSWVIEQVKLAIVDFLQENPGKNIADIVIACYGLSFKPDIDDLRESPALNITREIARFHKGTVLAVEPNIRDLVNEEFQLALIPDAQAIASISVLLVDHKEFQVAGKPSKGKVIDTKGIWR